jgi:hypothetical protein
MGVDMGLELILFGMDEVWDLGDKKGLYGFCMEKVKGWHSKKGTVSQQR